jgi:predicted small secreted protein
MKQLISTLLVIIFAVTATGCETVKGVGRDVEKAGTAIKKSAS